MFTDAAVALKHHQAFPNPLHGAVREKGRNGHFFSVSHAWRRAEEAGVCRWWGRVCTEKDTTFFFQTCTYQLWEELNSPSTATRLPETSGSCRKREVLLSAAFGATCFSFPFCLLFSLEKLYPLCPSVCSIPKSLPVPSSSPNKEFCFVCNLFVEHAIQ